MIGAPQECNAKRVSVCRSRRTSTVRTPRLAAKREATTVLFLIELFEQPPRAQIRCYPIHCKYARTP